MSLKKLLLSLSTLSALAIPTASISCSYVEDYIQNNIKFNAAEITAYDALGEFETGKSLKALNIKEFADKGIYINLKSKVFDYDEQALLIEAIFYTKDNPEIKEKTYFSIPFFDFKEIEKDDWKRIFEGVAKETQIIWKGKGEVIAVNRFGLIPEVELASEVKDVPTLEQVKYRLILDRSGIVTNYYKDTQSDEYLTGGTIINKSESIVTVTFVLPDGSVKEERLVKIKLDDNSYGGLLPKPQIYPTKEDYEFIGWSTQKDAKEPNVFLDSKYTHTTIKSDISLYPVFAKRPILWIDASLFNGIKPDKEIILKQDAKLTKQQIEQFVLQNIPQPADKWKFNPADEYFVLDEKGKKIKLVFNEEGELSDQFQAGKKYNLLPMLSHEPIYFFKDAKTNELLEKRWAISTDQGYKSALAPTSFKLKEERGKYLSSLVYKEDGAPYKENELNDQLKENDIIEVLVNFEQTRKVSISDEHFDVTLIPSPNVYLTPEGKLREEFLPQNVDYKYINYNQLLELNKYKIYGSFIEDDGKIIAEFPNNKYLDPRDAEEQLAGVVFDGWYADENFKEKIIFKDGISSDIIISKTLYPRFKRATWDKIRDAREIINSVLKLSTSGLYIAENFETIKNNAIYNNIKTLVAPFRELLYISLGGVISYDSLVKGELTPFGEELKQGAGLIESSINAFIEALSLIIDKTTNTTWFKANVVTEFKKLISPILKEIILKILILNKKVVDSQGVIIDIKQKELEDAEEFFTGDFTSLLDDVREPLIKLLSKALKNVGSQEDEEEEEEEEEEEDSDDEDDLEEDDDVQSMVDALLDEGGVLLSMITYLLEFNNIHFSQTGLKYDVPNAIKLTLKTAGNVASKIKAFKESLQKKLKNKDDD